MRPMRPSPTARPLLRLASCLLLAFGAGCATRPEVLPVPPAYTGFPVESSDEEIWIEAVLFGQAEEGGEGELIDEDALPVTVRIGTIASSSGGPEGPRAWLDPTSLQPRLILSDGTVLGPVSADRLERNRTLRRAHREEGLALGDLTTWTRSERGLLLFELSNVRAAEHFALTRSRHRYQELDLYHALLVLRVETTEGPRDVRVGLRPGFGLGRKR